MKKNHPHKYAKTLNYYLIMEREFLIIFLKSILPQFDLILSSMEDSHGWLNLPLPLIDNLVRLKLKWWAAYENEKLFSLYRLLMFVDIDTMKNIQTQEEAEILKASLVNEIYDYINSEEYRELQELKPITKEEKKELSDEISKWLEDLTEEERREFWRNVAYYWLGFFTTLFDILAVMIHGRSMRQLVSEAKAGDDNAMSLAIQIDRMVIYLPYFQERLLRAQAGCEINLLDKIGYRIKNPIIKGKIRRRTLWLLFAILESEGHFNMPLKDLLAICAELGVYGDKYGIGDENSLGKRKREYLKNRGTRKYF